jgi:alpha-L-fucosidase
VQGIASLRTTAKGKKVYVHVIDWPTGKLEINGLDAKVIAAHLLATGQPVTFRQESGKLQVDVASRAPDPNVSTIVLNTL